MLDHRQKKDLTKRIRFISGQLAAIETMIAGDRSPEAIYLQLRSVQSALSRSVIATFETAQRQALASAVVDRRENCPGAACDICDAVEVIRRDFPNLTIEQVLEHLALLEARDASGRSNDDVVR